MSRRALPLIALLALGLRIYPWWQAHAFRGVLEYDDGVYYGVAALLLQGELPYRDYTIVHPPGAGLLLLPAAAVGELVTDSWGMAAARILVAAVALLNTYLVYRLAARWSPVAGLVAATAYAVIPGAVEAEHTAMLEPLVTVCCLLAALLLTRAEATRLQLVLAGGLMALGVSTKLFAAAYLLVAAVWLLRTRGARAAAALAAGAVAGAAVFVLPFVVAAPRAFWNDVIYTQLARPVDAGMHRAERVIDMLGFGPLPVVVGAAAALLLVVVLVRGAGPASPPAYRMWVGVLGVTVVAFTAASSYFPHYGAFLAPAIAILLGQAAIRQGWTRPAIGLVLALFLTGSIVHTQGYGGQSDLRAVGRAIPEGDCVFSEWASVAVAADEFERSTADCPTWLDGRGVIYTRNTDWPRDRDFYFEGFTSDEGWQSELLGQLERADHLLISRSPAEIPEWAEATRSYALGHFALVQVLPGTGRFGVEHWQRAR